MMPTKVAKVIYNFGANFFLFSLTSMSYLFGATRFVSSGRCNWFSAVLNVLAYQTGCEIDLKKICVQWVNAFNKSLCDRKNLFAKETRQREENPCNKNSKRREGCGW